MDSPFDISQAKILRFVSGPPEPYNKQRWLLWPVWAWQVLLPRSFGDGLNLFSRTVLRLCQAGVLEAEVLAKMTKLPLELVEHILQMLHGDRLIDGDHVPTERGLERLDDVRDEASESGFMFQRPVDGTIWPFFWPGALTETVGVTEISYEGAKIEVGTEGQSRSLFARLVLPSELKNPMAPEVWRLLRACKLSDIRDGAVELGQAREWRAIHAPRFKHFGGPSEPGRIRLMASSPLPCLLAVNVYTPRGEDKTFWQVCDPFRPTIDPEFRERLLRFLSQNGSKAKALRKVLRDLNLTSFEVAPDARAKWLSETSNVAAQDVKRRLKNPQAVPEALLMKLLELEKHARRARNISGGEEEVRVRRSRENFCRGAFECLEELLGWYLKRLPECPCLEVLETHNDNSNAQWLLETLRQRLRVEVRESNDLRGFLRVRSGHVLGVLKCHNHNLKAQIAAWILGCLNNPGDPLLQAVRQSPEMLQTLVELTRVRNGAAHFNSANITVDQVERFHDVVYGWVCAASGQEQTASAGEVKSGAVPRDVPMATFMVDERFPYSLRQVPGLYDQLVQAQLSINSVQEASRVGAFDPSPFIKEGVINVCRCLEGALSELIIPSSVDLSRLFGRTTCHVEQVICQQLPESGFLFTDEGVPRALSTVRQRRIRAAFKNPQRATLGALGLACLLSAAANEHHPAREVARRAPKLLEKVARLIEARGHGSQVEMNPEDFEEVAEDGLAAIEVILRVVS